MTSSGCEVMTVEEFVKWRDQLRSGQGALGAPQNQLTVGYLKGFSSGISNVWHKAAMSRLTTNGLLALDVDSLDETGYTGMIPEFLRAPPLTRGYTGPRMVVIFFAKERLPGSRAGWDSLEAEFPGRVKLVSVDLYSEELYQGPAKGSKDDLSKVRDELSRVTCLPKALQNNFLLGLIAMKLSKALRVIALGGDYVAAMQAQTLVGEDLPKYQKLKWLVYAVSRGRKEKEWSLVNWASETDSPFMDGFKQGQDKTEALAFSDTSAEDMGGPPAELRAESPKADPPDLARAQAEEELRRVAEAQAEDESRRMAGAQAAASRREAEMAQRVVDEEAARRLADLEENARRLEEEGARRLAEEARQSVAAQVEFARRSAEEDAQMVAEEQYRRKFEEAQAEASRRAAEGEEAQRIAEEIQQVAAEDSQRTAEASWRAQEEEKQRAAWEDAEWMAQEVEAQRVASLKVRQLAEEEQRMAQRVASLKVRQLAEEEARRVSAVRAEASRRAAEAEARAVVGAPPVSAETAATARAAEDLLDITLAQDVDPDVDMRAFTRQMNRMQKGDRMLRGELESFATRLFAQLKLTEKPLAELRRLRVKNGGTASSPVGSRGGSPPGSPNTSSRRMRSLDPPGGRSGLQGSSSAEALGASSASHAGVRPKRTSWAPGSPRHTAMRVSSRDARRRLQLGSPPASPALSAELP